MEETQSFFFAEEKEIRVLDMLVTLAENTKLFIIRPLMVAICLFYIRFLLPQATKTRPFASQLNSCRA